MGKRKKVVKNKYTKNSRKTKKSLSTDMLGGFLVVIGVIFFILITFENMGSFSVFLKELLFGIFGKATFLIPIIMCIIGVYAIVCDEQISISNQLKKGSIIMIFTAPIIATYTSPNLDLFSNFVKCIVDSFNEGNGGVVGTLIAGISVKFLGVVPTQILFIFLIFVTLLCVFNISFIQFFDVVKMVSKKLANAVGNAFGILFRDDHEREETNNIQYNDHSHSRSHHERGQVIIDDESNEGNVKINKKARRAMINLQIDSDTDTSNIDNDESVNLKMVERGTTNPEENLKYDKTEQVEFDFNKLGGKPSEGELQAKQQRDEFFKKQKEEKEDKSIKEVLTLDHTNHIVEDNYEFPPIELLNKPNEAKEFDRRSIHATAVKLQKTLLSFGVEARVTNITRGPTVTRYELTPSTGVKVSKIVNLSKDIALNLAAKSIRIEAPIPGKAAVGIELPNPVSEPVFLREIIESDAFSEHKSKVAFGLGKNAAGEIVVSDIAKMPHTLIAGSTGSGKSVCINSILISILYKAKPSEVKLILVDPKMVELSVYNGIPHLLIPVVTDPKKAAGALNWAVQEMVNRYNLFASKGVRDIKGYNKVVEKENGAKLPQIVIIIDELADLMMVAPNDVEDAICRLAQMARAAGMHLIIATQRPSVDVITGIIKANIPSRIAFTVTSQIDSRTILDMAGAEKLLGKGDMLYFPTGETNPLRVQGAFVSDEEVEKIISHIKETTDVTYNADIMESIEKANENGKNSKSSDNDEGDDADVLLNDAIDLVIDLGSASASMLQRKLKVGYSRAGRMIDQMEERGLISKSDGSKARNVLISKSEWQELKMGKNTTSSTDNDESDNDTNNQIQPLEYNEEEQVEDEVEVIDDVQDESNIPQVQNVAESMPQGSVNVYYGNQLSSKYNKFNTDEADDASRSKYNVDL